MTDKWHPGDLAVFALIVLFAVLAVQLHDSVAGLAGMGRGIREAGTAMDRAGLETGTEIRQGIGGAAGTLEGLPLVGPEAAARLRAAADGTAVAVEKHASRAGQDLIDAGRAGEREARTTATLVGWFAFLVPSVLLLAQWLSARRRFVRPRASGQGSESVRARRSIP
jgi:hypothetical protein